MDKDIERKLREKTFLHEYEAIDPEKPHKEKMYVVSFEDALNLLENSYSIDEKELLEHYSNLNIIGKAKVVEFIEMLVKLPEYLQDL